MFVLPTFKTTWKGIDLISKTTLLDEKILRLVNSNRYHSVTTDKHIYTIPLCQYPEKWIPTGSLNFSMIDSPELYVNIRNSANPSKIYIFAKNHNFLTIENGLMRLEFST